MNRTILIAIIIAVLAIGLYCFNYLPINTVGISEENITNVPIETTEQKKPDVLVNNTQNIGGFSMKEVSQNNSESSCWSVVDNKVYNLTEWIKQHPGGPQKIISICGKDGTRAFDGQHMGDKKPVDILASFFIGNLK